MLVEELRGCGNDEDRADARRRIGLLNRGFAETVAARHRGRSVAEEDLVQVAYLGLVKAIERFDPEWGHDLLKVAVPTIRGVLVRYFRDHGCMVRPPRQLVQLKLQVKPVTEELARSSGANRTTRRWPRSGALVFTEAPAAGS